MAPWQRLFAVSLFCLAACAHKPKDAPLSENSDAGASAPLAPTPTLVENELSSEEVETNESKPYKSAYGEIALDDNQLVHNWISYFQGRGRHYMDQYLARSTRYLPMMKNVLRENGLPEELVYISLIESGFSPLAHSNANAVGYWQFIKSTGKRFGLTVDSFTDERRDPVLSTRAAAAYFKSLYELFGSWHLAMAAYNVGEMRVKRAVTRNYTRDFWALIKKRRALPPETKQYVPKFIAAVMIAKDPDKYGFKDIEYADPLSYDAVALTSPISLTKLASNLSVDVDELQLLNPKFRTDFVPISRGAETVVRIPVGRGSDALAALSLSVSSQPKVLQAEYSYYRIRRGETLSTVARKHHTTVSQLRRINGLSNRTLVRAGRKVKVPDNGGSGIPLVMEEDSRQPAGGAATEAAVAGAQVETAGGDPIFHVVKRGENLSSIAQLYGMRVGDLLKLNNLNSHRLLRRGQKLRLREIAQKDAGAAASARRANLLATYGNDSRRGGGLTRSARRRGLSGHVVRRGETLADVSRRYGVSLEKLARVNKISLDHRTLAGERLWIP